MLEAPLAGNVDDPEGSLDALMQVPYSVFTRTMLPWAVLVNLLRILKIDSQPGGIYSLESIPGLLKCLQIRANDNTKPGPVCPLKTKHGLTLPLSTL